jgi:DNA repair exonuclease SbcCD ATPase subunit
MQISILKLRNFRRFEQFQATFSQGLNLVKGPNEAGKSTIQDAIVIGLFDHPTGKAKERIHQQWGRDRLYEIELTYQLDEGEEYTLQKNYQDQSMEMSGPEGEDSTWSKIKAEVERAVGTSSEKLFLSTASIRQDAMAQIGEGRKEISTQLQRIVMGAEAEVEVILKKLRDRLSDLERGLTTSAPVNPGKIKGWIDRLSKLDEEIAEVKPEIDRRMQAEDEVDGIKDRLAAIEGEKRTLEDLHQRYAKRGDLRASLEQQTATELELERRIEKVKSALETKESVEAELVQYAPLRQLDDEQLSALTDANENLKAKKTEAQVRESDLEKLGPGDEIPPETKPRNRWSIALAGVGGVLGAIGLYLFLSGTSSSLGLPLLIVGAVAGIGGIAWLLIENRKWGDRDRDVLRERQRLEERYREGLAGVEGAQASLEKLLGPLSVASWEEYQDSLAQVQQFETQLRSTEVELSAWLDGTDSVEDLERERQEASRSRRDSREGLDQLGDAPELSAEEYQEMVNRLEDLESEHAKLREDITRREAILEGPSRTVEDLHQLEERRAAYQRSLDQTRTQAEVLHMVLEGVEQARQETLKTAKDELEPRLGDYLRVMTHGRYDTAFVDDDLTIRVVHEAREEPVAVEALSRGTQDQVYLAARLALSDLVFHGAKPPLLMDDPFATFDPQRKQDALELCQRLARDRQIILFTCQEGYEPFADYVIELD